MLEHFAALRVDLASVKEDTDGIKRRIENLAGAIADGIDELVRLLDALDKRTERIERRL